MYKETWSNYLKSTGVFSITQICTHIMIKWDINIFMDVLKIIWAEIILHRNLTHSAKMFSENCCFCFNYIRIINGSVGSKVNHNYSHCILEAYKIELHTKETCSLWNLLDSQDCGTVPGKSSSIEYRPGQYCIEKKRINHA